MTYDENGMPLEEEEPIDPRLMPDLDPEGHALEPAEKLDPYISERDKALATLTAFRAKRPSLIVRLSRAGGLQQPFGAIGPRNRNARILLRSLIGGVNTYGRMKSNEQLRNYADMEKSVRERQGVLDDAEKRNKDQQALQKEINAQLRGEKQDDYSERRLSIAEKNAAKTAGRDLAGFDESRIELNNARKAQVLSRMGWNPNTGRGGPGGSHGGITYSMERSAINAHAKAETERRANSMITMSKAANWTKSQQAAGIARVKSASEAEHMQMLDDLDAKWGVTRTPVTRRNTGSDEKLKTTETGGKKPDPLGIR